MTIIVRFFVFHIFPKYKTESAGTTTIATNCATTVSLGSGSGLGGERRDLAAAASTPRREGRSPVPAISQRANGSWPWFETPSCRV